MKVLEKQVEDGKELRAQLLEQVHDLQKQLQMERDENKKVKKRYQRVAAIARYDQLKPCEEYTKLFYGIGYNCLRLSRSGRRQLPGAGRAQRRGAAGTLPRCRSYRPR
jgi:DNA-binding protein H-NS